jgi:hypothetical protein
MSQAISLKANGVSRCLHTSLHTYLEATFPDTPSADSAERCSRAAGPWRVAAVSDISASPSLTFLGLATVTVAVADTGCRSRHAT